MALVALFLCLTDSGLQGAPAILSFRAATWGYSPFDPRGNHEAEARRLLKLFGEARRIGDNVAHIRGGDALALASLDAAVRFAAQPKAEAAAQALRARHLRWRNVVGRSVAKTAEPLLRGPLPVPPPPPRPPAEVVQRMPWPAASAEIAAAP